MQVEPSVESSAKPSVEPSTGLPVEPPVELSRETLCGILPGNSILFFEEHTSTNSVFSLESSENLPQGTVAVARTQSAGRGRMGREWVGPRGGLWFTILLRPSQDLPTMKLPLVSIFSGIAVADALEKIISGVKLKWPNDVIVNGKKICGILLELTTTSLGEKKLSVGIGVNVNFPLEELPVKLHSTATTLLKERGRITNENLLLGEIFRGVMKYHKMFLKGKVDNILERYRELSDTIGKYIHIQGTSGDTREGVAVDIAQDGALVLRTENEGLEVIVSGDVLDRL